jgi:hypothetical protein
VDRIVDISSLSLSLSLAKAMYSVCMKDLLVHLNILIASREKAHIGCYVCAFIVPFEKSMLTLFVSIEDICVFNLTDVYSVCFLHRYFETCGVSQQVGYC